MNNPQTTAPQREDRPSFDSAEGRWATARGFDLVPPHWDEVPEPIRIAVKRIVTNMTAERAALSRSRPAPDANAASFAASVYEYELTRLADAGDVKVTHEVRASIMLRVLEDFVSRRPAGTRENTEEA